jgi:hypothetical protein
VQAPPPAELLRAWERSAALAPLEREDLLLELVSAGDVPRGLPVGMRDARLLELRELLFGGVLEGAAECERCGEALEYSMGTEELRRGDVAEELELSVLGRELRVRVPTGADLADAAATGGVEEARALLVERSLGSDELPSEVLEAVAERLAEVDPLADASLALTCPACGHEWTAALEIGAWLWLEVESWARRTVLDVHALASAYGWSEAEILALGPRRELYLELVEG